jgi:dipeptidyl-peptidase III
MKISRFILTVVASSSLVLTSYAQKNQKKTAPKTNKQMDKKFEVECDNFADLQVLRYEIEGFNELTPKQKELAYYLFEAANAGRDIIYDQKYKHNLTIRKTIEAIFESYNGVRDNEEFKKFETYAKRVFFSNGIHHHYSNIKFIPEFSFEYFSELVNTSNAKLLPLNGLSVEGFLSKLRPIIFDPNFENKTVDLGSGIDNVKASANNFYEGVTQKEVEEYYEARMKKDDEEPISWGLNSKMTKVNGEIVEKVWKVEGMYGQAISKIVYWLEKAVNVAENENQKTALKLLVEYYKTGDLKKWDEYNIAWVADVNSRIDVVNGFIEVYDDAIGKRASFESVVSIKDLEATKMIAKIAKEAQWFEDNSPIAPNHKKTEVKGITAKVITVVQESGASAQSTPIGINLPNANWIRQKHGSKSVSLGNIVHSYNIVGAKSPMLKEFAENAKQIERAKLYGSLAGDLLICMK